MSAQPSHADLREDLRHLIGRIDGLVEAVATVEGEVKANGEQAKTQFKAMNDRLEVIEAKVMAYDLLKARVAGMVAAGVLAFTAVASGLWWALHTRIEDLLGIK